jgi:recombination protein RecA
MILSFQVAALVPKCELDQLGVVTNQDLHSRMMTQALRKINYSLSRSQALLVFVNQVKVALLEIGACYHLNVNLYNIQMNH